MSIFGFFFIILLIIFVLGFSIISAVFKAIFGIGRRNTTSTDQTRTNTQQQEEARKENSGTTHRKKVFDENEGEYVEFEEIKDDNKQ